MQIFAIRKNFEDVVILLCDLEEEYLTEHIRQKQHLHYVHPQSISKWLFRNYQQAQKVCLKSLCPFQYFACLTDETNSVIAQEELSLFLRYVGNDNRCVQKDFFLS